MLDEPTIIETDEDGELFNKAMSVEVNDLYECSHCELLFPTEIITKEHELTVHHKKNTNELPCNVCCFKTNTESSLYQDDDETTLTEVSIINDNPENPSQSPNLILTESEQNILKEHLANNRIINELDFKCGYCKNRYEDKMDLVKHFESCTTVECQGQVQCRLCYYTDLITRRIHAHYYNSHSTNYFTCNYCNIKFLMLSELLDHKKYNHSNELKLLECDICNKKFTCQKSLDIHTFFHKYESSVFAGFNEKKLFTTIDSKASNETKVNKIHICLECNKQFKNNEDLLEHINDKHDENTPYIKEYPCNEFDSENESKSCKTFDCKNLTKKSYKEHSAKSSSSYFHCDVCKLSFKFEQMFRKHVETAHNDITYLNKKIYKCSECSLKTIERSVLIKHMRRHSITFETASTIIPKATYSKNIITKDSKSSSKTT
ncbi:zinc finger protein 225-like [Aphidius gifuensis]|uniref:zinc finger protein 225-like n=1 Tax=Aphidius gifuensis TaxID=684658 RepID=UPI001CDCC008|nr:zinc finger protein 225-like [Aphidius gifuensis]